jgi:hypothetical protein
LARNGPARQRGWPPDRRGRAHSHELAVARQSRYRRYLPDAARVYTHAVADLEGVPTHHPSPVVAPRGRPGWGWRSLRRIARDRIDVRVCPWAGGCGLETSRRIQGHHSARDSSGPEHHHCGPDEEWMLPDGSLGPSAHRREPQPRWLLRRNAVSACGHPTLLYAAEAASVTFRGSLRNTRPGVRPPPDLET